MVAKRSREDFAAWEQLLNRFQRTTCEGLIVGGVRLYCHSHSDAKNPEYKREENEMHAKDTLEHHRTKFPQALPPEFEGKFDNWQGWMMYLLKPICRHYHVDDEAVLRMWTRDCMPSIIYEQTGELWLPKPSKDETL